MRITSKGQVTIPQQLRQQFGLLPHTEVEFLVVDGGLRIVPVQNPASDDRGARIVRALRGRATVSMSTDEIMDLTRST